MSSAHCNRSFLPPPEEKICILPPPVNFSRLTYKQPQRSVLQWCTALNADASSNTFLFFSLLTLHVITDICLPVGNSCRSVSCAMSRCTPHADTSCGSECARMTLNSQTQKKKTAVFGADVSSFGWLKWTDAVISSAECGTRSSNQTRGLPSCSKLTFKKLNRGH